MALLSAGLFVCSGAALLASRAGALGRVLAAMSLALSGLLCIATLGLAAGLVSLLVLLMSVASLLVLVLPRRGAAAPALAGISSALAVLLLAWARSGAAS